MKQLNALCSLLPFFMIPSNTILLSTLTSCKCSISFRVIDESGAARLQRLLKMASRNFSSTFTGARRSVWLHKGAVLKEM